MRYIDKIKPCLEFDTFLKDFGQRLHGDWEKLKSITLKDKSGIRIKIGRNVLITLFQHLRREQKSLCIYCQQSIPEKTAENANTYQSAHFEHVKKQELHKNLIFNQKNLSISCNGFDTSISFLDDNAKIKEFCGHFKDGKYNSMVFKSELFLNPLEIQDIEHYFEYEFSDDDAEITILANKRASKEQQLKADFTIQTLGLNKKILCEMRRRQFEIIREQLMNGEDVNDLLSTDYEELPAFYSMLKSQFLND